eukprot:6206789-Pleurochrysis_carterae.AAC.5
MRIKCDTLHSIWDDLDNSRHVNVVTFANRSAAHAPLRREQKGAIRVGVMLDTMHCGMRQIMAPLGMNQRLHARNKR